MNSIRIEGLTIFLLFFGVATLEAFQTHNWIKAAFCAGNRDLFFAGG